MKRIIAYLLLAIFAAVTVPREVWHHCEAHLHHCDVTDTHYDDTRYHPTCDICDFKLSSSEAITVCAAMDVIFTGSERMPAPCRGVVGEAVSDLNVRGPPALG